MGINAREQFQTVTNEDERGFEYTKGLWYLAAPDVSGILQAGNTLGLNSLRLHPFLIRSGVMISKLGTQIGTGAAGSIQLGIYRANLQNLWPENTPVMVTGDIDASAAANVNGDVVGGPMRLEKGLYWAGVNCSIGGVVGQSFGAATTFYGNLIGSANPDIIASAAAVSAAVLILGGGTVTYGTWPDLSNPPAAFAEFANSSYTLLHFLVAP